MAGREPFHRFVIVVRVAAGVAVVATFLVLGITAEIDGGADRTWFDRAFPFVVAVAALVVTVVVLRRDLRADRADPSPPGATGPTVPAPGRPAAHGRPPGPPGTDGSAPGPPGTNGPPHELSPAGRAELDRILDVLDRAGISALHAADRDRVAEGLADLDETMTAFDVLCAAHEAGFLGDAAGHTIRTAFHATQVEQDAGHLRAQIADLDRLAGTELDVSAVGVEAGMTDGSVRLRLVVDGSPRTLAYRGAPKRLSTVLHGAVATALRDKASAVRLAWLWSDAGAWVAALPSSFDLDGLDTELRAPEHERWEWIDEQEPFAAGDSPRMAL